MGFVTGQESEPVAAVVESQSTAAFVESEPEEFVGESEAPDAVAEGSGEESDEEQEDAQVGTPEGGDAGCLVSRGGGRSPTTRSRPTRRSP